MPPVHSLLRLCFRRVLKCFRSFGTAADPDAFGDVASLTALGLTTVAPDAAQAVAILDIGTSDLAVQATVTQTGVPTTGVATLTITYRQV